MPTVPCVCIPYTPAIQVGRWTTAYGGAFFTLLLERCKRQMQQVRESEGQNTCLGLRALRAPCASIARPRSTLYKECSRGSRRTGAHAPPHPPPPHLTPSALWYECFDPRTLKSPMLRRLVWPRHDEPLRSPPSMVAAMFMTRHGAP